MQDKNNPNSFAQEDPNPISKNEGDNQFFDEVISGNLEPGQDNETPDIPLDSPAFEDTGKPPIKPSLPHEEESPPPEPVPEAEVQESKVRRFFRKFIRWATGLLIIFGLGLLTGILLLYQPAAQEAERTIAQRTNDLNAANDQNLELQNKISDLEGQIADLQLFEQQNEDLLAAQDNFNLHIAILDARVDVTSSLLALSGGESAQARIILDQTAVNMDHISEYLDPEQRGIITTMKQRLELILEEMEKDPYAAQSDLDVLGTNLLQLEDSLFND